MRKRFKRNLLAVLLVLSVFSLTACGGGNGGSEVEGEPASEVEQSDGESSSKGEQEAEKEPGTRSNPVEIGETVQWEVKFYADMEDWDALEGLAEVTLNKVYRGDEALDMLYFGEEALEDVEEGFTYAVADMTVKLVEGSEDDPYTTSFEVGSVSEDGRESPSSYTSLSDEYEDNEYTDLYPGGEVNMKKAFLIPEEGDFLVEIEENISGNKFFNYE